MNTISVEQIQSDPAAFLHRIEAGETLVVVRENRPLAEVMPVPTMATEAWPVGLCAGQITVPADFGHALPENLLDAFEG